jgi:hypothetical protein
MGICCSKRQGVKENETQSPLETKFIEKEFIERHDTPRKDPNEMSEMRTPSSGRTVGSARSSGSSAHNIIHVDFAAGGGLDASPLCIVESIGGKISVNIEPDS